MANTAKLLEVLVSISQNLSTHDQQMWGKKAVKPTEDMPCGTTFCLAGHAIIHEGYTPIWIVLSEKEGLFSMASVVWNDVHPFRLEFASADEQNDTYKEMAIEAVARKIFDFTPDEVNAFFYEAKTFGDLMAGYQALMSDENPSAAIAANQDERYRQERYVMEWLAAERNWKINVQKWLVAESRYKANLLYKEAEERELEADAIRGISVE